MYRSHLVLPLITQSAGGPHVRKCDVTVQEVEPLGFYLWEKWEKKKDFWLNWRLIPEIHTVVMFTTRNVNFLRQRHCCTCYSAYISYTVTLLNPLSRYLCVMFTSDGAAVMTSTLIGSSTQTDVPIVCEESGQKKNALGGLSVLLLYCKHVCIHTDWLVHKRLKNTTSCMFCSLLLVLKFQYNFSHKFSSRWLRIQLLATQLFKYYLFVENIFGPNETM